MERVEMDDGVKLDGYRRILTVDDDSHCLFFLLCVMTLMIRFSSGSFVSRACHRDGDERGAPAGCGPRVLGNYLSSLFFSSFCRFDSLPTFMLHEPITEFLTEFLSCSCGLCAWWRWRG